MSKARMLVAGAMLVGALATTPVAQAKGIGGQMFNDIPAAATTQVIKYAVSWFTRWADWFYWFIPTQPTQPPRP